MCKYVSPNIFMNALFCLHSEYLSLKNILIKVLLLSCLYDSLECFYKLRCCKIIGIVTFTPFQFRIEIYPIKVRGPQRVSPQVETLQTTLQNFKFKYYTQQEDSSFYLFTSFFDILKISLVMFLYIITFCKTYKK